MTKGSRRSRRTTSRRSRGKTPAVRPTPTQWSWGIGLAMLSVALITLLSLLSRNHGSLTRWWLDILHQFFGWGTYLVPFSLAVLGVWVITLAPDSPLSLSWTRALGVVILFVVALSFSHHLTGGGGGQIGYWTSQGLRGALGWTGALVVLLVLVGLGLALALDVSIAEVTADLVQSTRRFGVWYRAWRESHRRRNRGSAPIAFRPTLPLPQVPEDPPHPSEGTSHVQASIADPAFSASVGYQLAQPWTLPQVAEMLIESDEAQMSLGDIREKTRIIEETLTSLGVPVTVVEVNPGPVVTQFGLEPGYVERRDREGKTKRVKVKVSRISALSNDLALALAASPIRIEAPVPGKAIVGLEVPNNESAIVGLRGVMESRQFRGMEPATLNLCMGRNVSGGAIVADLAELPHLLIAGATGTGKSVCINALIACLLCQHSPNDLRLLMIDPKRVELSIYNGIPHLLAPVVVEVERVVGVLNWVAREMERRYKVFAKVGARHLRGYNELASARGESRLPFVVVFIDELADLMMVAPDQVERLICRIAQLARATGIHLVIATQRPSVDVVTGLIKANFPARMSFAVSSQIDSRVILDAPGADKLLGRGDALYMAPDSPQLLRVQGCYVSDVELGRLVGFWKGQVARRAEAQMATISPREAPGPLAQRPLWPDMQPQVQGDDQDPLLEDAIAVVSNEKRASVSFLQRRLRIGYTRAARLVDTLEEKGLIGPATGSSRARQVLGEPRVDDTSEEDAI